MSYVLPIIGYLVGSISTAILICRAMGLADPRTTGSGNPGTTNVLRVGGKLPAALTLMGDAAKGLVPVLLAHSLNATPTVIGLTALGSVLGHLFPVFFQFKGGKGVATAFGAAFGLSWIAGLLAGAVWLAVALMLRYSSLAALCAMATLPLFIWITTHSAPLVVCSACIAVLVFYKHSGNISRLRSHTEPKIGQKKTTG